MWLFECCNASIESFEEMVQRQENVWNVGCYWLMIFNVNACSELPIIELHYTPTHQTHKAARLQYGCGLVLSYSPNTGCQVSWGGKLLSGSCQCNQCVTNTNETQMMDKQYAAMCTNLEWSTCGAILEIYAFLWQLNYDVSMVNV